jgi:cell division transport system permease protein
MWRKGVFLTQEAFRTIRRHKGISAISVVIMSLSLLMLAVFLLATDNLLRFVGQAQEDMQVYVYLEDRLPAEQIQRMQYQLLENDEVETVAFISKEQALTEFRDQLGEDADLVDALEVNPLPASFWVTPKYEYRSRESMAYLAGKLMQIDGVDEVRYGEAFLDKFAAITRGAYFVDIVVGFIVILSAIFIIANAVRLTVFSRRKNIQVLKLVGATNRFITMPFIIEGALQGGVAAVFSLLLLYGVTAVSRRVVPDLSFFSGEKAAVFLLTCVAIGSIGSFAALRRFLKV